MTRPRVDQRPRLTLEDYILFFTTRSGHGLTMDHLNQIISMHGFIKLHRHNKTVMVDALNSMDLMRPRRSTVSINAVAPPLEAAAASASAAALLAEGVTRDIEDIGWRECPLGSVLSVRAGAAASSPTPLATILPTCAGDTVDLASPASILDACSLPPPPPPPAAEKRKRSATGQGKAAMMRRKKRMVQLLALPSLEDVVTSV